MRHLFSRYVFAGVIAAGILSVAALAGTTTAIGNQGALAKYTAGNLDEFTAGAEGKLVISGDGVAYSVGTSLVLMPYAQIRNVELGALIEEKRKGFHFTRPNVIGHRQITVGFTEPKTKMERIMTLQMDEDEAVSAVQQIELHTGRRRRNMNGDTWWGDSAWKTKRNGNAVKPEGLGDLKN